jgi:tRNA (guanine37-N1)-methyltransferase
LLDSPQYTRPQDYEGMIVPEVLVSGDHKEIELWRRQKALEATRKHRPDLLDNSKT